MTTNWAVMHLLKDQWNQGRCRVDINLILVKNKSILKIVRISKHRKQVLVNHVRIVTSLE